METMNLTQYEQMQKKMNKILEIFKFDKDDWTCKAESKTDEMEETLSRINATLEELDSGHEFTQDNISDLQKEVYENHKDTINAIESQNDEIFKLSQTLDDILKILKSNTN